MYAYYEELADEVLPLLMFHVRVFARTEINQNDWRFDKNNIAI